MIDATGSLWSMLGVDPYRKRRDFLPGTGTPEQLEYHKSWQSHIDELQRRGVDVGPDWRGGVREEDLPFRTQKDKFDYFANYFPRHGVAPRREDFEVGKPAQAPSGGNVFANLLGRPETDTDFWDALKEQLADAGKDYDAADQPFKNLAANFQGTARPQAVPMPSMMNTVGIPTGGSYNPYIAKRKRTA